MSPCFIGNTQKFRSSVPTTTAGRACRFRFGLLVLPDLNAPLRAGRPCGIALGKLFPIGVEDVLMRSMGLVGPLRVHRASSPSTGRFRRDEEIVCRWLDFPGKAPPCDRLGKGYYVYDFGLVAFWFYCIRSFSVWIRDSMPCTTGMARATAFFSVCPTKLFITTRTAATFSPL